MSLSLPQLQAAIAEWVAENFPGRTPRRILIVTDQDDKPLALPIAVCAQPTAPKEEEPHEGRDEAKHSKCVDDILDVLEAAKKPLSRTRILSALARAGKEWSERHVARMLKRMMEDGTLTNPESASPPGYRFPEWDSTSGN